MFNMINVRKYISPKYSVNFLLLFLRVYNPCLCGLALSSMCKGLDAKRNVNLRDYSVYRRQIHVCLSIHVTLRYEKHPRQSFGKCCSVHMQFYLPATLVFCRLLFFTETDSQLIYDFVFQLHIFQLRCSLS